MKGIILAGGSGTRLHPITLGISKQLMPIYNKPMIYYPLSTLIESGIHEIMIISAPDHLGAFESLLGSGEQLGCKFVYAVQDRPNGLAEAFIVGEEFIGSDRVTLILGDNIFYGSTISDAIRRYNNINGAAIFGYQVSDPERYGVVEFDANDNVKTLEEKPEKPKSHYAQTGIYICDNNIISISKNLKPSARGELEVTDAMVEYLKKGKLKGARLEKGTAWLDTGTFQSMNEASQFVEVIEKRQGVMIGSIEEAAYRSGFIDTAQLKKLAKPLVKSGYGKYLMDITKE